MLREAPRWRWYTARAARGLGVGALFALAGCSAPPSYTLNWSLVANDGDLAAPPELESVRQCSEVGVSKVRVTVLSAGREVSELEYPCFPGAELEGPALEPGSYTLVVEGLRRSGVTWDYDAELTPEDQRIAYTSLELEVVAGQAPSLEFVLRAPPECDDGIDNDGDGRVDFSDPACLGADLSSEATDGSVSLFQSSVRLLAEDSTLTRPLNVGINTFVLEAVDATSEGEPVVFEIDQTFLDYDRTPFQQPLQSALIDSITEQVSEYQVTLTGLDAEGSPVTEAITAEPVNGNTPVLAVSNTQSGFYVGAFVVRPADFLAPLSLPASFSQVLRRNAENDTQPCALGGKLTATGLEQVRIRVLDAGGTPLDAASLALVGGALDPVDDGEWVSFACPLAPVLSAELDWGTYTIELEGRVGADLCFTSSEPVELVPSDNTSAQIITLERALVDGAVAAACQECDIDDECGAGEVCEANICVPETFSDG